MRDYADELQRARHRIADRNVFGVDSNPVALELAEVSLWLKGIHQDGPRAVVRLPADVRQLAGGRATAGASVRRVDEAERALSGGSARGPAP